MAAAMDIRVFLFAGLVVMAQSLTLDQGEFFYMPRLNECVSNLRGNLISPKGAILCSVNGNKQQRSNVIGTYVTTYGK